MASNKEIVKVLKVETKGSDVSVRALRTEIAALRDVLLNTEQGSEEYNAAVQQIKQNQDLLAQAMNATKTEATALEGSYNALTQKLAELKQAWKATNDEVERSRLTEEINEVKGSLKDLDNSIGNFQSNVGNYANSFKEAMNDAQESVEPLKAKFESVQKVASGLASGFAAFQGVVALMGVENEKLEKTFIKLQAAMAIAQGIGGLGDLIEGVSKARVAFSGAVRGVKTFIMSLRGIKLAIASTGIGLLVVAIGMLVEHLMSMADAEEEVAKGAKEIETATTDAQKKIQGMKDELEKTSTASKMALNQELLDKLNEVGIGTSAATEAFKEYQNALDSLSFDEQKEAAEKFTEQLDSIKNEIDVLQNTPLEVKTPKVVNQVGSFDGGIGNLTAAYVERKMIEKDLNKQYEERQQKLKELEAEYGEYHKVATEATKAVQETVIQNAKKENERAEEIRKENAQKALESQRKLKEKLDEIQSKAHQKTIDTEKEEIAELTNTYNSELALLKKYGRDTTELTEAYLIEKQAIIDRYAKKEEEEEKERTEKRLQAAINAYNKDMFNIDLPQDSAENEVNNKEFIERPKYTTLGFEIDKTQDNEAASIQLEIDKLKELMSIREQYHQQRLKEIDELIKTEGISEEDKKQFEMEKMAIEHQYTEQKKEDAANLTKFEKEQENIRIRDKKLAMQTSLDVASNIAGGLASILGENTKAGKIAATAQATIDTYKAANSAYASMAGIPIVGPALGAAAAAMAVVSGIMNVKKIWSVKEDQMNNPSSSSSSAAQSMVRPNISLSDVIPTQLTQNVMTDSELSELNQPSKVYVTETDIADVTNKVEVTETNASF
jgi:hypothetical protein